ncbi:MAG: glutaredoxin family protein [Nostocoides sp.]
MTDSGAPRVTLIGKPECHLCVVARGIVAEVCADLGVGWTEVSILDHPELGTRYAEMIPVTLVDGRQHDYWRVDPVRLREALTTT